MRYKTRETAFVGSSSDGLDDSMSPPIVINLNRYNSVDGRSRLIVRASLKLIKKARALIGDPVDLASIVSTRDNLRAFDPTPCVNPCCLK